MNDASVAEDGPKRKSGTALRVISVLPLIPGILWLMFRGPRWAFHIFVLTAITIASWELMSMKLPAKLRPIGVANTVGFAAAIVFGVSASWLHLTLLAIVVVALLCSLAWPNPIEGASGRAGWLIAGPIYIGATLSAVDLVHGLPNGGAWVLLTMVLAWASDTSAYFVGRKLGRTKLYPSISPKKTVEGALGGLAGSVVGAVVLQHWLLPEMPVGHAVLLALVAGCLGQAGDLLESLLKRSSGVKDSGGILPGHGGLLDRVDALMFTAPVTWAYATLVLGLTSVR